MSGFEADGSPIHVQDDLLQPITTFQVSGLNVGEPEQPDQLAGFESGRPAALPLVGALHDDARRFAGSGHRDHHRAGVGPGRLGRRPQEQGSAGPGGLRSQFRHSRAAARADRLRPADGQGRPADLGFRAGGRRSDQPAARTRSSTSRASGSGSWPRTARTRVRPSSPPTTSRTASRTSTPTSSSRRAAPWSGSSRCGQRRRCAIPDRHHRGQDQGRDSCQQQGLLLRRHRLLATTLTRDALQRRAETTSGSFRRSSRALERRSRRLRRTSSAVFTTSATPISAGPLNIDGLVDVEQVVQNDITGEPLQRDVRRQRALVADERPRRGHASGRSDQHRRAASTTRWSKGFMPRVTAPRGVAALGELRADSTITDLTPEKPDSTGTWYFAGFRRIARSSRSWGRRTTTTRSGSFPDTTDYCWNYASGEVSFVASFKQPFEVWDLGFNSLSRRVRRRQDVGDGPRHRPERILDLGRPALLPGDSRTRRSRWTTPGTKSTDYVPDGSDQTLGRFDFELADTNFVGDIPPPTTIRIISQRFTSADAYRVPDGARRDRRPGRWWGTT